MRLSRRSLLKTAARLGAGAALAALGIGRGESGTAQEKSEGPYFQESASKLTLGNQYYEVDFDKQNGAITRILDKRGGRVVSEGNADGLWAFTPDSWRIASLAFNVALPHPTYSSNAVSSSDFNWTWSAARQELMLKYNVNNHKADTDVTVTITVSDDSWFDLSAFVEHRRGERIEMFGFPHQLAFRVSSIRQALITVLPGLLLQQSFFTRRNRRTAEYPGRDHCGDLTWIERTSGTIAIYPLGPGPRAPATIGYTDWPGMTPITTRWEHRFAAGIEAGQEFQTPKMRIAVGNSLTDAISNYRLEHGIDAYPALNEKLDDIAESVYRSPFLKMPDMVHEQPPWYPYRTLGDSASVLDKVEAPSILHTVAVTEREGDRQNPDWWPPAELFGGEAGYRALFRPAQRSGFLVMPYSNPTWWNPTALTAAWLDQKDMTLQEVAALRPDLSVYEEQYGGEFDPAQDKWVNLKPGIVVSPSHPQVITRMEHIMRQHEEERSDLVLEDQLGSRSWLWDYNPDADGPLSYSDAWLKHTRRYRERKLTTEGGDDQLAETEVGFFFSFLIWEHAWGETWGGTDAFEYFPASALMVRDKVLFYQHNLEGHGTPSVTESLYTFRWNLTFGYQLNFHLVAYVNQWLDVVSAFSHHVLGRYANELMEDFAGNTSSRTVSVFPTTTVTANWTDEPLPAGSHTLVPGGVVSTSRDGTVTGGVFQSYNGHALSPGEHYVVEQRERNGVIVRQPMGEATTIHIHTLPTWQGIDDIEVRAFSGSDHLLSTTSQSVADDALNLRYDTVAASNSQWDAIRASIVLGTGTGNGLRQAGLGWTETQREIRAGRPCLREVGMSAEQGWGMIGLIVDRDILGATGETDVMIDVDWFDGADLADGQSQHDKFVGVVYDGAVLDPEYDHSVPNSGWVSAINDRTWKSAQFICPRAVFRKRLVGGLADIVLTIPGGVCIGKVTVTNADELERRTVAYYTIHDPTQGETLTQGLHLRGWTDATQPIADLNLNGLQAIYAWDADAASWLLYSPDIPARFNNIDTLEQGRAYYVRVRNGQTLHWPDAPYGGVGFHLQPGRNLVCWLGTPDKPLTDAIAPLRGMKAEPLVSVTLDGRTYDVEESRSATEPLPYGQALWVEIDAVGTTRWLQF